MTDRNQKMRDALKEIEATVTTTLAQQPEDDEKCGQALYHALVKVHNMAQGACHLANLMQTTEPQNKETDMANENETHEDIIAEMRDEGHTGDSSCLEWVGEKMRHYADRLDAARKRMERTHKKELETRDAVIQTEVAAREAEREAHKREVDALVRRRNELNAEVAAKDEVIQRLDAEIRKYQEERELRIAAREKLLADLDRIRILETSFPLHGERKTHYLLTYTPKDIPIADEKYQLTCTEIVDLIEGLYKYVKNSRPVAEERGDESPRTGQETISGNDAESKEGDQANE